MPRTLVITEKFSTALRIAIVLSDGRMKRSRLAGTNVFTFDRPDGVWNIVGLRGHIVELDYPDELSEWSLGNLPKLIEAPPEKRVTAPGIVDALKQLVHTVDRVVIATDFDREGELIGMEILEILLQIHPGLEVRRAHYSALTRDEIETSFTHLVDIDRALADAAAARQEIDLLWGALLTRYLTLTARQHGSSFLSAGRVQTPTLALLVERDQAIKEFVPSPFWTIEAQAEHGGAAFRLKHAHGIFEQKADAEKVLKKLDGASEGKVLSYEQKDSRRRPPIPFSTTLFVAEATRLGLSAALAMRIAEDLYTKGIISYPRTDNTVYPRGLGLRGIVERFREGPFGEAANFVLEQPSFRPTRGRSETTDHPPIYPTQAVDPKKLRAEHAKVYELIVRRFLATLAPDAVGFTRDAEVDVRGEKFTGHGQELTDPGWYRIYPYSEPEIIPFPVLAVGDLVKILEVKLLEDKTKPPRRFTQGSIIQEMERLGLGTKSTRHDVLQKLFDRHYVQARSLEPTGTGIAVTEALTAHAPVITRPEMTHRLEDEMALVAESKKARTEVLDDSREMLREAYDLLARNAEGVAKTIRGALDRQHFVGPCVRCGGALRLARSPRGSRWVQCVNNPATCTASYPLPAAGFIEPAPEFLCGTCKVPRVKIVFRGQRPDLFCINPECPEHKKQWHFGDCPSCHSPLNMRYSFRGNRFVGCTGYPKCRVTYSLPQRGKLERSAEPCPVCHAPVVTAIEAGRPPWTLCINPECPTRAKAIAKRAEKRKAPARRKPKADSAAAVSPPATAPVKSPARPRAKRRSTRAPEVSVPTAAAVPPPDVPTS